jgi:hypothetical protein
MASKPLNQPLSCQLMGHSAVGQSIASVSNKYGIVCTVSTSSDINLQMSNKMSNKTSRVGSFDICTTRSTFLDFVNNDPEASRNTVELQGHAVVWGA